MRRAQAVALAGLMSVLTAGSVARAAIIPTLDGSPTANGSNYDWSYDAQIGSDFRVKPGDFFTLYDFGFVAAHSQPAGWTFSTTPIGTTPFLILPDDNPDIANVTFTYNGPGEIFGNLTTDLGHFVLTIDSNQTTDQFHFGAQATRNGGTQDGRFASDYGVTIGPAGPDQTPFPEPTAMALMTLAAPWMLRRRRTA